MSEEEYHAIFHEVIEAKSRFWFKDTPYFFLHPTPQIKSKALLLFKDWKRQAESRGVPSEKQSLNRLIGEGKWSKQEDDFIENIRNDIRFMHKAEQNLSLPTQKMKQKREIKKNEAKLTKCLNRKKQIIGKTSEDYANTRSSQELIRLSVIGDNEELIWSDKDEFDELEFEDFMSLSKLYQQFSEEFNDDVIQNLVLQDFFYIYMPHCEKPSNFFGKPMIGLTSTQLKTTTYGNVFYQIMQQNENISDVARKDPEQLFAISADAREKRQGNNKKHKQDNGAKVYFGAEKEDMDTFVSGGDRRISIKEKIAEINKNDGSKTISGPSVAALFGQ